MHKPIIVSRRQRLFEIATLLAFAAFMFWGIVAFYAPPPQRQTFADCATDTECEAAAAFVRDLRRSANGEGA